MTLFIFFKSVVGRPTFSLFFSPVLFFYLLPPDSYALLSLDRLPSSDFFCPTPITTTLFRRPRPPSCSLPRSPKPVRLSLLRWVSSPKGRPCSPFLWGGHSFTLPALLSTSESLSRLLSTCGSSLTQNFPGDISPSPRVASVFGRPRFILSLLGYIYTDVCTGIFLPYVRDSADPIVVSLKL